MRSLALIVVVLGVTGCGRNARYGANCQWPPDHEARRLDLSSSSAVRHLADDAQNAEDIAIRHADLLGSRPREVGEYRRVREECKAALFATVARQHGVSPADVDSVVGLRRIWLDALVVLAFAALVVAISSWVLSYLFRSALADAPLIAIPLVLVMAIAIGAAAVGGGNVWFSLIESVRVGNGHMSYRVERMPVRRYGREAFAVATATFLGVATVRYRRLRHPMKGCPTTSPHAT